MFVVKHPLRWRDARILTVWPKKWINIIAIERSQFVVISSCSLCLVASTKFISCSNWECEWWQKFLSQHQLQPKKKLVSRFLPDSIKLVQSYVVLLPPSAFRFFHTLKLTSHALIARIKLNSRKCFPPMFFFLVSCSMLSLRMLLVRTSVTRIIRCGTSTITSFSSMWTNPWHTCGRWEDLRHEVMSLFLPIQVTLIHGEH